MASTSFTLPDGLGTAVIRDPKAVPEGKRRPVTRVQMRLAVSPVGQLLARKASAKGDKDALAAIDKELTELIGSDLDSLALLDDLNDALIVALVESFNGSPVTDATDLPSAVYDALKTETAKYVTDLMPSFTATPDPASPTPPSAT